MNATRITVWNENWHEQNDPDVLTRYPDGIHGAIARGLAGHLGAAATVRTATQDQPEHGLTEEILAATDTLVWWGHMRHEAVADEVVGRVVEHVLGGMGLVVLHSGHFSRPFRRLLGTTCSLGWRNDAAREHVWTVSPRHPIVDGVDLPIVLDQHETYSEFFDIPAPDETIFLSSFSGGEVFRSGVTFTRGHGRIFYFSPGDEAYPIYHHPEIQKVIANGAQWVAQEGRPHHAPAVVHLAEPEAAAAS
ncbi:ThuA domain-containing protein [Gryllotalpicola reticulitermitis]|uniref:ThuA domain-containing protein n=1 Tax=Gryllotalpicola reticulitermitis TaxID=1184153 RepID=A0ABV8Q4S3_9MICO